jgi:hypothetical protein
LGEEGWALTFAGTGYNFVIDTKIVRHPCKVKDKQDWLRPVSKQA